MRIGPAEARAAYRPGPQPVVVRRGESIASNRERERTGGEFAAAPSVAEHGCLVGVELTALCRALGGRWRGFGALTHGRPERGPPLNRRWLALHTRLQMGRETRKEAAVYVCRRVDPASDRNHAPVWLCRTCSRAGQRWARTGPMAGVTVTRYDPSFPATGGGDEKALQSRRQTS